MSNESVPQITLETFMRRIADPRIAGPGLARPGPEIVAARRTAGGHRSVYLVVHGLVEPVPVRRPGPDVIKIMQRLPIPGQPEFFQDERFLQR